MGIQKKSLTLLLILTAVSANALNIFDASTIFNLHGSQIWSKTFGGIGGEWAFSVVQTSDGGYALVGSTYSSSGSSYDFWLIKTDSSGNELWNKTFGGPHDDGAFSLAQTIDGGYALAGSTYAFGAGLWDAWLIKTDSFGNVLWSQTYGGISDDQAISMTMTRDGGFVLSGSTNSFGVGGWDAWVIKVSNVA